MTCGRTAISPRRILRITRARWSTTAPRARCPRSNPDVDEVRIGFLGPIENHPEQPLGQMMLNGAPLAIEEANARGGYGGKPFRLMVHNDQAVWGASSNEIVKMVYDEKVWAMLGSVGADSTHIALRVSSSPNSLSSTRRPRTHHSRNASSRGTSPPFRMTGCRAIPWRGASIPILGLNA